MNRIVPAASALTLVLLATVSLQSCQRNEPPAPPPAPVQPVADSKPEGPVVVKETTERLFQNPYDADAVYFLSQKNGTPEALTVLIKRDSQEGTQYSRWLFNCTDKSAQNLGVAANVQALDLPENSMPSKSQTYEPASKLGAIATEVCK